MLRTILLLSILSLLSCKSTETNESNSSVNLVQKLEEAIFTDPIPHPDKYSELLSEIDSLKLIDAIGDLERLDSMIFCKWVEPDKLREWVSCYYTFYAPLTNELEKTILSLKNEKRQIITKEINNY